MGDMAKTLLPIAGTVIGASFGIPGVGGALGSALGGAAGGAIGTALAGSQRRETPQAPALPAQPVMPSPDSAAVAAAQRRSIAEQTARRGRASTILTQNGYDATSDRLGA